MRTRTLKVARPAIKDRTGDTAARAVAAPAPIGNGKPVGEGEIRLRAYQKWEAAGKPDGDGTEFWLEAERELLAVG
jgi:hypothetical protein